MIRIAQLPVFQRWLASTSAPGAEYVHALARRMTFEQAQFIIDRGGIKYFQLNKGCSHACPGCQLLAGKAGAIKRMSWLNFTKAMDAIAGLEDALQVHLVTRESLALYLDSDSLTTLLPDGRSPEGGKRYRTVGDALAYIMERFTIGGVVAASSGWPPESRLLNDGAQRTVQLMNDHFHHKHAIRFNMKLFDRRFIRGVRNLMAAKLNRDPVALVESDSGRQEYDAAVVDSAAEIVRASDYIADRVANLKLLRAHDRAGIVKGFLYRLPHRDVWGDMSLVAPLMLEPGLGRVEAAIKAMHGVSLWSDSWMLLPDDRTFDESSFVKGVTLMHDGSIGGHAGDWTPLVSFSAPSWGALRCFADNPLMCFEDPAPSWKLYGMRLKDRRYARHRPPHVTRSIADRIRAGRRGMSIQVHATHTHEPIVDSTLNGEPMHFDLITGLLTPATDREEHD